MQKILNQIELFKDEKNFTSDVVVFADGKAYSTKKIKLPYNWEKITVIKSYSSLKNKKVVKIAISEMNPEKIRLIQNHRRKRDEKKEQPKPIQLFWPLTRLKYLKKNRTQIISWLRIKLKNFCWIKRETSARQKL